MKPKHKKTINAVIVLIALAFLAYLLSKTSSRDGSDIDKYLNEPTKNHASVLTEPVDSVPLNKLGCQTSECSAGTKAVTYTSQQEPFYTCKTGELSDYANHVLGLMVLQGRFTESLPKMSATTGEPEVAGNDKYLMDRYREKAGVSTFEEALAKCYRGIGNLKVVVLYSPKESNSIYVVAEDRQENKFWLPRARLYKD